MAVSVTSTVNLHFGSQLMTSFGVILNDEMDDFSSPDRSNSFGFPPSVANFIAPGKRPQSTMTPTILESARGGLGMVVGGSGGSRIVTGVLQVVLRELFGSGTGESVGAARVHEQLLPVGLNIEARVSSALQTALEQMGHSVIRRGSEYADAVVQLVCVLPDATLQAACDWRKQGLPEQACMTAGI